ncbi:MAG TPA: 50S ribosomal protein L16 [Acetobacteraceae bacterium]
MLSPKRTKYRKAHKGRIHGLAKGGTALNFGAFGLKALEPERVTARQIEAARRAITRAMKRAGRVWIRIFPDVPVSLKPADIRAKGTDNLQSMLLDLRKEQFNLRFQRATGQTEGVGRVREVRRDIARVKTIMAEQARARAGAGPKS